MEFKGTKTEWEVVEHNWSETSICSNGKTICSFELDDIEEEENAYNIQLIKHSKEMLEMLQRVENILTYDTIEPNSSLQEEIYNLIKQATEL